MDWRALLAAYALGALLFLGLCTHTRADGDEVWHEGDVPLTSEQGARLYHDAVVAYLKTKPDWKAPPRYPNIAFASYHAICQILTHDLETKYARCAEAITAGEYAEIPLDEYGFPDADIVMANDRSYNGDAMSASVVFHEILHYIAYYNDGPVRTCEKWLEREHEAYALQARWLETHGGGAAAYKVMMTGAGQKCVERQ